MGRTAKFTDDLLLEAVIKYAEVTTKPIKATELALWARDNIEGLEEVKDYHFTRPVKNPSTGKNEKKLCTRRIEEINIARDTRRRENKNVLLSSVNIDKFFDLDVRSQRKEIREAREIVSEYRKTDNYLRKRNDYCESLVAEINKKIDSNQAAIKEIKKKQAILDKKVATIRRVINDENIRKQLEEIGILDGEFDLLKYNDSLKEDINSIFNIEESIRQYQKSINREELTDVEEVKDTEKTADLLDDLLDF